MVSIVVVDVICVVVLLEMFSVEIYGMLLVVVIVVLGVCLIIMCVLVLLRLNDDIVVLCGLVVVGYGVFLVGMNSCVVDVLMVGFYWVKCKLWGMCLCCIVSIVLMNLVILVVVFRWLMLVLIDFNVYGFLFWFLFRL